MTRVSTIKTNKNVVKCTRIVNEVLADEREWQKLLMGKLLSHAFRRETCSWWQPVWNLNTIWLFWMINQYDFEIWILIHLTYKLFECFHLKISSTSSKEMTYHQDGQRGKTASHASLTHHYKPRARRLRCLCRWRWGLAATWKQAGWWTLCRTLQSV